MLFEEVSRNEGEIKVLQLISTLPFLLTLLKLHFVVEEAND